MYWQTLGFKEPPFALTPNPHFLFMSSHHQEALAHLLFAVDTRAGFIELSGEVGTGKTTIIRTLLSQLSPETHRSAFIFNPAISPTGLLQEINREFGLPAATIETHLLHQALNEFLLQENSAGRTVILVIDEAQNLSPEVLEQLRLVSNLETEQEKLIQIVLVGQPELRQLLGRQELRQLNQRITVRYHLEPMERTDVRDYIRHRIRIAAAGGEPVVFSDGAAEKIGQFSGGLPRLVNAVCDRALLIAYSTDTRVITQKMTKVAIADLTKTGSSSKPVYRYAIPALISIIAVIAVFSLYNFTQPSITTEIPVESDATTADGVKMLQMMLKATGHFQGIPDGIFDNRTEQAVRSFQRDEGIFVDGNPGGQTLARLYRKSGGRYPDRRSNNRQAVEGGERR